MAGYYRNTRTGLGGRKGQGRPDPKVGYGMIGGMVPKKPKRNWADIAQIIGAGLQDWEQGGGHNLDRLQARFDQRDHHRNTFLQQQQKQAQAQQTADQYGLKGRERLAYLTNPDEYGKNLSTNYGAATVGAGAARVYGNGAIPYINHDTVGAGANANNAGKLLESIRSNKAVEALRSGELVESKRAAQMREATNQQNADTAAYNARHPNLPTGMVMGENGPQYMPNYIAGQNQMRKAGRTNVTVESAPQVGTIPQGYQLSQQDGAYRMEPIAGGPVANSNKARANRAQTAGGTVLQDIGRALENVQGSNMASGPVAGQTRFIPGSPADVTNRHVQSALSNIGIDQLQSMRDASPTGGALGQIPVQQQKRLEQMLGSLDVTQPDDIMQDNLMRVQNIYNDIVHGEGQGPERHQLSFDEQGQSIAPPQPTQGMIHKGHIYLGGDPKYPRSWRKQ